MPTVVKIAVAEHERGWGSKIDDWMVCLSVEDANKFKTEFNTKNTKETAPDWYMVCTGNPLPMDVTDKQFKKLKKEKRVWLNTLK